MLISLMPHTFGRRWFMERDIAKKIQEIVRREADITETDVRLLLVHIRKRLELIPRDRFSTLSLFCTWTLHTGITNSVPAFRLLKRVNDALVNTKTAGTRTVVTEVVDAIGFDLLRFELKDFLDEAHISHNFTDNKLWINFHKHLLEIIRDIPIVFPPLTSLKLGSKTRQIYDQIIQNPVKPGFGVVSITLSYQDYDALGLRAKGVKEVLCLTVLTEDGTSILIPLVMTP